MKRWRWPLLGALVLVALGALAARERHAIRMRWLRGALARATPDERMKRLAALDAAMLDEVAFDPEPADEATRAWRQSALNLTLWKRQVDEALLIRLLREARGLDRRETLDHATWPKSAAMIDAASKTMLDDPDVWAALRCAEFLRFDGGTEAVPALRRAARQSPHEPVRFAAVGAVAATKEDANAAVLEAALGDISDRVGVAAAAGLFKTWQRRDGVPVLVDALRGEYCEWAASVLRDMHEKRAALALAHAADERHVGRAALRDMFEGSGEIFPEPGESWLAWVEARKKDLPDQLTARPRPAKDR